MIRYRLAFAFTLFLSSPAFSQRELAVDTTSVNQLIKLSLKDQWTDPYRSFNYAEQALKQAEEINYRNGIAIAHNLKGFSYWTFGDNELAIQSAHDALDIAEETNLFVVADSYYIMARGYMDLRENNKAHEFIVKAQNVAESIEDWTQLCSIYNLRGVILYNADKFDSALYLYNKAYEIGKSHPVDPINLPRIISNIGECYTSENPALAFRYFNEALDLAKKTNNKIAEASITSIIGHAHLREKDLNKAEVNLQAALRLAQELGLRRVMRQAYGGLVDIRLAQGKGNEAVVYLRQYYAVRDSLLNTSKVRQIVELETKHELKLKEKDIKLLEQESRIQTIWKNLLIGLVVLVVVMSIAIFQWQRYRHRKNREVLNLEIDYLIQQHKEAVDKYKTLQLSEVADNNIESHDQRLLKQAMAIVEANISDSQMSVERMADEMNMSRTSLHRKIKSITGFPPSELIRSIRLRKAARMIASRTDSATQIALAVGFEDYSHFSKAFKKHFGVSPSSYEEQSKTHDPTSQKVV
jgi:AraC-like DNA-binding protein